MESQLKTLLLNNDYRKIELEFRIGMMVDNRFISSLPKVIWNQMKSKMTETTEEYTIIDKYLDSGDRNIATRFVTRSNGEEFWEQKNKVHHTMSSNDRFEVRTSVALEEHSSAPPLGTPRITSNAQFAMQRKKMRASYTMGPWRVDFSRVEQIPQCNDVEELFEVEVELADNGIFFEKEVEQVLHEGNQIVNMLVHDIVY
jgi:hypothetical protein